MATYSGDIARTLMLVTIVWMSKEEFIEWKLATYNSEAIKYCTPITAADV